MRSIGIDIGTTATKVVLFDDEAGLLAQSSRPSPLFSPHPGWAEADTASWLANAKDAIGEVLAGSGVPARDIAAISTTGMVPALVLLDDDGAVLRPAILQNDARAVREIEEIADELADLDLVQLTGSALTQQSIAPTLAWLHRHEPDVFGRARSVAGSYDWLLRALGAEPHVERNWALESGLFTIRRDVISRVCAAGHTDPQLLPPVRNAGSVVGTLSAAFARETGLSERTLLVVGGADHVLSAYAAGVNAQGEMLIKLGGAGDILAASDRPLIDKRLYLDAHPRPGTWLPNGCMATSGSLIRWYQRLVGGAELAQLDHEAATRPAADVLCLPYFLGEKSPLHDPELRGAYAGLHLGTTRADLHRATLEAIAFGFRHHLEVFDELGLSPSTVMVTNGGSRSTLWKHIHASVLGQRLHPVANHPGASLGAAAIAAIGAARRGTDPESADFAAIGRHVRLEDAIEPDDGLVKRYDEAYSHWRELGAAMTPTSHYLARQESA